MTKSTDAEVAVVGLGLIGSAALRYLADSGVTAIGIGPAEPVDWKSHDGPFASHYDSGRIARVVDDRMEWAELARRSLASLADLEERTGIEFHRPSGVVHVAPADRLEPLAATGTSLAVDFELAPSDPATASPYRVPPHLSALCERAPAGHLDPRSMLRAQLAAADSAGAVIKPQPVTDLTETTAGVEVRLANGEVVSAQRVLVAAGAYTGSLLPPLAFRVKTETTILARIDPTVALEHQHAPALLYDLDHPEADEVYLVPPVLYPDGNRYLKMGCNLSSGDRSLHGAGDMAAWMGGKAIEQHRAVMTEVLGSLLPDFPIESLAMKPCLVTYTSHGLPYLDQLSPRMYVAAGGNGAAAKSSDALGAIAAGFVKTGAWTDSLPARSFRAVEQPARNTAVE